MKKKIKKNWLVFNFNILSTTRMLLQVNNQHILKNLIA